MNVDNKYGWKEDILNEQMYTNIALANFEFVGGDANKLGKHWIFIVSLYNYT